MDTDADSVEVWTPESAFPITERVEIRWEPAGAPEPLVIRLEELFKPI